jgi:hypothetical protein
MSDLVNIRIRLHIPGARVGQVVAVEKDRAARLVAAKYAVYVNEEPEAVLEVEYPPVPDEGVAVDPGTTLPDVSDKKAAWAAAAENLGIDLYREDGSDKTKQELIDEVTAAVA